MKYIILAALLVQGGGGTVTVKPLSSCKTLEYKPCTGCTDGTQNILCKSGTDYKTCTGPTWLSCAGTGNQCRQYGSGVACTSGAGQSKEPRREL